MLLSLHQTDENVDFISTPGSELHKTIEQAIEFCKKNNIDGVVLGVLNSEKSI